MKREWWKEAVVYQIYPRSFKDSNGDGIGDLKGIIEKLDYIKSLGIDVIWLNPVYDSPDDDNGYDIRDYRKIHSDFGSMEDWEELIDLMHKKGLKLIMDLVVNHSSDEHEWFIKSKSSTNNPYRDYYYWIKTDNNKEPNGIKSIFGGSTWEYNKSTDDYYLHLFSKKQPDLNWENEKVREEVYSLMSWWLDKGIDGFRMDVISFISKNKETLLVDENNSTENFANGPRVHEFLKEMNQKVLSKYDIMTVGECPGTDTTNALDYIGEDRGELNMLFNFDHMEFDIQPGEGKWSINKNFHPQLKNILSKWQLAMEGKGWNSIYFMNHDQPRTVSRFGSDSNEFREISAKMLVTITMTLQGTPYVYMGEEIGMTNCYFDKIEDYRDLETLNIFKEKMEQGVDETEFMEILKYRSRDNSRTPMQWNDNHEAGFTTGKPWINVIKNYKDINVEKALSNKNSIFYYYQNIIKIRKETLSLIYGTFTEIVDVEPNIFAYYRTLADEKMLVVINMADEFTLFKTDNMDFSKYKRVISNYNDELIYEGLNIKLKPFQSFIYKVQ